MSHWIGARHNRAMGGKREGGLSVSVLKEHSISCDAVQIWGSHLIVAVTTQHVSSQSINGDQENGGKGRRRLQI